MSFADTHTSGPLNRPLHVIILGPRNILGPRIKSGDGHGELGVELPDFCLTQTATSRATSSKTPSSNARLGDRSPQDTPKQPHHSRPNAGSPPSRHGFADSGTPSKPAGKVFPCRRHHMGARFDRSKETGEREPTSPARLVIEQITWWRKIVPGSYAGAPARSHTGVPLFGSDAPAGAVDSRGILHVHRLGNFNRAACLQYGAALGLQVSVFQA